MKKFLLPLLFLFASILYAYGNDKEYRTYRCLDPEETTLDSVEYVYDPADSAIYSAYEHGHYWINYNGPLYLRDAFIINGRYIWKDDRRFSISEDLEFLWLTYPDKVLAYSLSNVEKDVELIPVSFWDNVFDDEETGTENDSLIPLWLWKILLFLLAILPISILIYYICRRDRLHPEPVKALIIAFLMGACISVPLTLLYGELLMAAGFMSLFSGAYIAQLAEAFVLAAIPEESAKLLALWLFLRRCKHFDEYMDGIVYAVCVGMGFACVENVMYVFSALDSGTSYAFEIAVSRAFTSVIGHYGFAVILGYFYSLGHFTKDKKTNYVFMGLLLAILAHGLFDFFLGIVNYGWGILVMMAFYGLFFYMHKWGSDHIRDALERDKGGKLISAD